MRIPSSHRHLLAASGRYPQRHVMILWNADPAVVEVEVIFAPREAMVDIDMDDPWFGFDDYVSEWDFARGNASTDWLTTERHTPAAVFGQLLARGFSSRVALFNALEEFAQIEEAGWAREMLGAFG
jgi:hypothetical protein